MLDSAAENEDKGFMKILGLLLLWLLLFCFSWPLALLALFLWPVVWIISIPFRILAFAVSAVLSLIKNLFMVPARLLALPFRT